MRFSAGSGRPAGRGAGQVGVPRGLRPQLSRLRRGQGSELADTPASFLRLFPEGAATSLLPLTQAAFAGGPDLGLQQGPEGLTRHTNVTPAVSAALDAEASAAAVRGPVG